MNEAQINKLNEINVKYKEILDTLSSDSPAWETQSWEKQEMEAREYLKLKTSSPNLETLCPLLLQIAKHRELDFDLLVEKVIQKADLYWHLYGVLTGLRQNVEDRIKNANNDDELNGIELNFDLQAYILEYQKNKLKQENFITIANRDKELDELDFFSFNAYEKMTFEGLKSNLTINKEYFYNVIHKSTIDLNLALSEVTSSNLSVKKILKEMHTNNRIDGTLTTFYKDFDTFSALMLDYANTNIF